MKTKRESKLILLKKFLHWQDWEMAMVLPNPDYGKQKDTTITAKKGKKIFKDCF